MSTNLVRADGVRRMLRSIRPFVLFAASVSAAPGYADDKYVADRDGQIQVACRCVAGTSGCQSKLLDALSGKERIEWTQEAFMRKGTTYNLDQLCYRKRDVAGAGDGQCCEIPGDEIKSIQNLFRGKAK